jgi:hypothetical protein
LLSLFAGAAVGASGAPPQAASSTLTLSPTSARRREIAIAFLP